MAINPWQEINSDAVFFIIDAAHSVEERLLLDWLDSKKRELNYHGSVGQVVVPIAHDPENIPTQALHAVLEVPVDTLLVPLRVVWKTKLDRTDSKPRLADLLSGNPRRPGQRKAQKILASDSSRAVCIMGVPATLKSLKEGYDERQKNALVDKDLAEYIAGQASLALEVAERRLRGSRYKVPRQVAKQIRASDRYKRGLMKIINDTGDSEQALRQQAIPIFKELVAVPHNFWQDLMAAFNRWAISLGYEEELVFDEARLTRFRQIVREHPTALLWTHKTHMDGLAMQSVLFEHDFPTPHTMGGINMAFGGFGFMARRAGAIFIRRSFQDNPLYKLVLRTYLAYLLEKRFPLTWSFEGTRSRMGKLMPPRYGMLKYVMDAIADSSADNLHIIPVAINYDMINDVKDYAAEQSGAIKKPESLSWLIGYLRRLRQPLGRIYVDFGEPVIVDKNAINDDSLQLAKIAFQVGVEANRVTPITLTSLMSLSLLGAAPRAQTIEEMRAGMGALRAWAEHRDIRFTSDFDRDRQGHMTELVDAMVNNGLVTRYDEGPEVVYAIPAEQHAVAGYYRNTIVHHFVTKAVAELALVHAANAKTDPLTQFWLEVDRLRDMFKFEFFYAPTEEFQNDVKEELRYFDADWDTKLKSDEGFASAFLSDLQPLVAHATLRPYIESYRIVADVFAGLDGNQSMDQKTTVAKAFKYARQAYLQRRISSLASIGQLLFENAYKSLEAYDLIDGNGADVLRRRKRASKGLRILSHRLEHIRTLAMPNEFE